MRRGLVGLEICLRGRVGAQANKKKKGPPTTVWGGGEKNHLLTVPEKEHLNGISSLASSWIRNYVGSTSLLTVHNDTVFAFRMQTLSERRTQKAGSEPRSRPRRKTGLSPKR